MKAFTEAGEAEMQESSSIDQRKESSSMTARIHLLVEAAADRQVDDISIIGDMEIDRCLPRANDGTSYLFT